MENQFYVRNNKLALNSVFVFRKPTVEKGCITKPLVWSLAIVVDLQHGLLSPL
jgi:hypothetical protein